MDDMEIIKSLQEALAATPGNIPLRLHLARLHFEAEKYEEAEEQYRAALKCDPREARAKKGLAEVFAAKGKLNQALVILEAMLEGGDPPADAEMLRSKVLLRMGEIEQAREAYEEAVGRDPGVADPEHEAKLNRGGILKDVDFEKNKSVDEQGRIRVGVRNGDFFDGEVEPEKTKVDFSSVGGMEALKENIRIKIIYPLKNHDLYKSYGKSIGGGILMYGPPGCGKTHLAKATAGEIKVDFISVGLHDVLDMYLGESESKLHAIFETARRNKPCVIFFDEVDALGARRSDLRQSAGRTLINQFLYELDGMDYSNDGLMILAATNAPWHVDPAFRRPGRFDRLIFVPPPDQEARAAILRIMLDGKPMEDMDYELVAKKTEGFSGADIKGVVDRALDSKIEDALKYGKVIPLRSKDLLTAAKGHKSSLKEWFATARNYAVFANQDGMYDEIAAYLKIK